MDDGTTTVDDTTTITVEDNDIDHSISAVAADITEGNSGTTTAAAFLIERTGRTDQPSSVDFAVTGGTADNGTDYTNIAAGGTGVSQTGNTITFAAGATQATISIDVIGDTLDEGASEDIELTISGAGTTAPGFQAAVSTNTATKAIIDDDDPPTVTLSLTGSPLDENGGTATVTAELSAPSGLDVTVNLNFSGTAVGSGTDYTASAGTITISAGDPDGSITLTGDDDGLVEGSETIIVAISTVTNGTEDGTQSVTAGITDDDAPPQVVSSVRAGADPTNAASVDFTVTFSKAVLGVDSGDFSLSNTGVTGASVTSVTGSGSSRTVTVNTGSGDGTIRLDILDDDTITDTAGNPLGGTGTGNGGFTSGEAYTIDKTAPTVTLTSSAGEPTRSSPFAVTVEFSEAVSGFALGDISVTNGTAGNLVATTPGQVWTVDITPTADGLVSVDVAGGVAQDAAGNPNTTAPTLSRTFDGTAPTVSIGTPSVSLTNSGPVTFEITYTDADSISLAATDVTLNTTGTATGSISVSGSGNTRTVTIDSISGDGTLGISLGMATASDAAGNLAAAAGPSTTFDVDNTAPTVTAITRVDPNPTSSATVSFTVTLSEAVTGLDAGDFVLTPSGGITGAAVTDVSGSDTTWTVTVDTGSDDGTLRLDLADDNSVRDAADNPLGGSGVGDGDFTTGESYTVDKTHPTVTIEQATAQADPTSAAPINFTVEFSEPVDAFAAEDITLSGTAPGTLSAAVTGGPTSYTVAVSGMTGTGTVIATVDADVATDAAGNGNMAAISSDNEVTFDPAFPIVTGIVRADADPTSADSVTFTVTFAKNVTGVDATDFTLTSDGTLTGVSVETVTGSDTTWTVTVNTGSGSGTLRLDVLDDDTIVDAAGNPLGDVGTGNGDFTSGEAYTLDRTAPTAALTAADVTPASDSSYTFTVTYSDNLALLVSQLDDNDIRVTGPNGFDQPATFVSVDATDNGTPRTATYQISAPGGTWDAADNGDYTVAIAADQVADTVGNSMAAGTLGSFRVVITTPGTTLYLPLIVSTPVTEPAEPDLVVTSVRLDPDKTSFTTGEPVTVVAVIENRGTADAGAFWVDLSLNPDTPPVDAGHIWNWHCALSPCYGVAWYVDAGLAAGEQITLTSTEDSFAPVYTRWPGYFAPGTTDLYVYVDSWHPDNQAGAVLERDETNNRAELHGLSVTGDLPPGAAQQAPELPQRPAQP
ncbi:MAG: Ig-like domain-containing protein [Chloroflexaceae bacterium]